MAATFRTLLLGYSTSLRLYLGLITGDTPASHYVLTHSDGVYSVALNLVGEYIVRIRETDDGPTLAAGYVRLVDATVCEPVDRESELVAAINAESLADAILAAATASVDEGGPPIVIPPSDDPEICVCVLRIVDITGLPVTGANLVLRLTETEWKNHSFVFPSHNNLVSNINGEIMVDLVRGISISATVKNSDKSASFEFVVPDQNTFLIIQVV